MAKRQRTDAPPKRQRSEAQRAASRANGRRSRGPKTAEGKSRSRGNALRHGLRATSLAVLPATTSGPATELIEAVQQQLAPSDVIEAECAEGIAMALWRLRRARHLEEAILAGAERPGGENELATAFSRRANSAGAMALLLRYRNQAMGELDRWFRLLEARRSGASDPAAPGSTTIPGGAAMPTGDAAADAANDNRPVGAPLS